mgnify:CR=1 FL=1
MPILQPDEWRKPFFNKTYCSPDVIIPTKDYDAYSLNPDHRWAYNKLMIADKQNLLCGPHGLEPPSYPVFSKPTYNLKSMGASSGIIYDPKEYRRLYNPGHMWCEILEGEHISTDVAVKNGEIIWYAHTIGHTLEGGTFDYWEIIGTEKPSLETYLNKFVYENFQTYTGMMNFETIGNKIIEMHLRFADQWPDLYGEHFVANLVKLYDKRYADEVDFVPLAQIGYSFIIFLPHAQYAKPHKNKFQHFIDGHSITSIQFPFDENVDFRVCSMPPGGFRVAIINGFDKGKCIQVRDALSDEFKALIRD